MWLPVPVVSMGTAVLAATVSLRPLTSPFAAVKSAPAIVTSARAKVALPSA